MFFVRIMVLFAFLFSLLQISFGANNPTTLDVAKQQPAKIIFDPFAANKTLDQLNTKLSTDNLTIRDLEKTVLMLSGMRDQARDCETKAVDDLKQLSYVNPADNSANSNSKTQTPVKTTSTVGYVASRSQQLTNRLTECRLFIIRSKDSISAYERVQEKLAATRLFHVEHPIWQSALNILPLTLDTVTSFDSDIFMLNSGVLLVNISWLLAILSVLMVSLFFGWRIRKKLTPLFNQDTAVNFSAQIKQTLLIVFRKYCLGLFFLIPILLFSVAVNIQQASFNNLLWFMVSLLAFIFYRILTDLFFYPPKPAVGLSHLPENIGKKLSFRLKMMSNTLLVGAIAYLIIDGQPISVEMTHLLRTIFLTVFAINLFSIVWLINHTPILRYHYRSIKSLMGFLFNVFLLLILLSEWFGFHNFARYLVEGIAQSLLVVFITWFIRKMVQMLLQSILSGRLAWQQRFRYTLGISRNQSVIEFVWLRIIVDLFMWLVLIVLLLRIWGYATMYWREIIEGVVYGFQFTGLDAKVKVLQILFGCFLFTISLLFSRWLRTRVARRSKVAVENGAREALATIVGYLAVSLSALLGLYAAGVNFAGLAIIAGALSFGIGIGLQNIVNNFLSGLILLIERPIKLGDRIVVGNSEGYVKKISIRSTQIQNLQRADVIVPNSELISNQVTNFMLHDLNCRFSVAVGVAYGTNTELVKKCLLDIASQHPLIIHEGNNAPEVIFKNFGDSCLQFELWCTIKDVNQRYTTMSDLHFSIDKMFRQHKIEIPFPQQVIRFSKIDDTIEGNKLKE